MFYLIPTLIWLIPLNTKNSENVSTVLFFVNYSRCVVCTRYLLCNCRNGSVRALLEMIVISEYVSEYCIWLVLRDGLQQLSDAGQLPFTIVDLNTTGIVVSGKYLLPLSNCQYR